MMIVTVSLFSKLMIVSTTAPSVPFLLYVELKIELEKVSSKFRWIQFQFCHQRLNTKPPSVVESCVNSAINQPVNWCWNTFKTNLWKLSVSLHSSFKTLKSRLNQFTICKRIEGAPSQTTNSLSQQVRHVVFLEVQPKCRQPIQTTNNLAMLANVVKAESATNTHFLWKQTLSVMNLFSLYPSQTTDIQ